MRHAGSCSRSRPEPGKVSTPGRKGEAKYAVRPSSESHPLRLKDSPATGGGRREIVNFDVSPAWAKIQGILSGAAFMLPNVVLALVLFTISCLLSRC